MTRKHGIAIAAAGLAVCGTALTFRSKGETRFEPPPPCRGMLNGQPDPIIRIEVGQYRRSARQPSFAPCAAVVDAHRVAQVDTLLQECSNAWQRIDGELGSIPQAKFTFIRASGAREDVTLISEGLVTAKWLLRLDCDAYLMFDNLIEPLCVISPPIRSNPSPLTWLFNVVCR